MEFRRLLPLSGVVFVMLIVIAFVALGGDTPMSDDSAAKVASFYNDHRGREIAAAFVAAASVPFLFLFGIGLATSGGPDAGRRSIWEYALVAASTVSGGVWLVVSALHFALADAAKHLSPSALQALNVLDSDSWVAFNGGLGLMLLAAAGVLLTRIGSMRWLGWVALVLGIALFIPYADFFALLLTGVWILVVSVMTYLRRGIAGNEPAFAGGAAG